MAGFFGHNFFIQVWGRKLVTRVQSNLCTYLCTYKTRYIQILCHIVKCVLLVLKLLIGSQVELGSLMAVGTQQRLASIAVSRALTVHMSKNTELF